MTRTALTLAVVLSIGTADVACAPPEVTEAQGGTSSLIIGGTTASIASWPGMAFLQDPNGQFCGATLVAPQWVVTAAHCIGVAQGAVQGIDSVVIGRTQTSATNGEAIRPAFVVKHAGFNDQTMDNDIALVRLSTPATSAVALITTSAQWTTIARPGVGATVVGWGMTQENGQASPILRQVTVPLVATSQCSTAYKGGITANMICAGFPQGGKDSCQGDSGGPLFMMADNRPVQIGVVSFGEGCARAGIPGVYTRIANYLGWMSQTSNGEVGATATTTPVPVPVPVVDAGVEAAPPAATEDADELATTRNESTGDADEEDAEEETSTPRTKKAAVQPAGCSATSGTSDRGTTWAALGALFGLGLIARRRRH